jgi:hypothetical protein
MSDNNNDITTQTQRWTVHVPLAHKIWRTIDRRKLDGFSQEGHLYLTCTLAEAQAIARQTGATRLQGNGWPTRIVGRGESRRERPDLEFATCDNCGNTGSYAWGACVNGKMTHRGNCFQCQGKGYQDRDDQKRNFGYFNHLCRKAFNEGLRRDA